MKKNPTVRSPRAATIRTLPHALTLIVEADDWKKIPRLNAWAQQAARATADHLPKKLQFPFSATLLLTGNAAVRRLNRDFRGIDKATNVLSFPQHSPAELPKIGKNQTPIELGDIAIAYAYTLKESKENNTLPSNHVIHLVIHGLLHLFGYDHMIDQEAEAMEKLEITIMQALGLPNPYSPEPSGSMRRKTTQRKK